MHVNSRAVFGLDYCDLEEKEYHEEEEVMLEQAERQRERDWVYHVNGDGTNQDTLLCCRVWSECRAVHKPRPRLRSHTSWFASWSPSHRSQSTDSMTTTPPTAHALQTPTNTRTNTHDMGMRNEGGREGGRGWSIPSQARGLDNERNMRY